MDRISAQRAYRKKCLEIVEAFLTGEEVSADQMIDKCLYITRNDYSDIVTERSLIDLCGYAVCQKKLSETKDKFRVKAKQKYKIDSKNNRIYDIEERKQFCSDFCYKASNYLKEQISEEAVYLRTGPQKPIHLYNKDVNNESAEELEFGREVINKTKQQIKPKVTETKVENKKLLSNEKQKQLIGFPYIKEEYLDQLKDQMKDLKINERSEVSVDKDNETVSEQNQQKSAENLVKLSEPLNNKSEVDSLKDVEQPNTSSNGSNHVSNDSISFEMIANNNFVLEDEEKQKKLSEMQFTYAMLCAKLDSEERTDQMIDEVILGRAKNGKSAQEYERQEFETVYSDDFEAKFEAFRKGKLFKVRNRKVKFADKEDKQ